MRRATIAVVLALLFGAAPAAANEPPPPGAVPASSAIARAYVAAMAYWQQPTWTPPGCSTFSLLEAPAIAVDDVDQAQGMASSTGPGDGDCWIVITTPGRWPRAPWVDACIATTHELGHLRGLEHSSATHDVMAPATQSGWTYDPPCYRAARSLRK